MYPSQDPYADTKQNHGHILPIIRSGASYYRDLLSDRNCIYCRLLLACETTGHLIEKFRRVSAAANAWMKLASAQNTDTFVMDHSHRRLLCAFLVATINPSDSSLQNYLRVCLFRDDLDAEQLQATIWECSACQDYFPPLSSTSP